MDWAEPCQRPDPSRGGASASAPKAHSNTPAAFVLAQMVLLDATLPVGDVVRGVASGSTGGPQSMVQDEA